MGSNPKADLRRRLCDLLEEQQEPFMLDIYLLEHGYSLKRWDFDMVDSRCWSLQKPAGKEHLKKRRGSQSAIVPRIFKFLVGKLLLPGRAHGAGSFNSRDNHSVRQFDGSSSSGTSTPSDQFFSSEAEESLSAKDSSVSSSSESMKPLQLSDVKDEVAGESKQLSPVSVLETSTSEPSSPSRYGKRDQPNLNRTNYKLLNRVAEESVFFWSMWETLINIIEEKHGFGESELQHIFLGQVSSSQSANTELVLLHQRRQLLFDYVREVVECITRKGRALSSWGALQPCTFQLYPGPEQLAKVICRQIFSWSKTAGNRRNTGKLVEADFSRERDEWIHFKSEVYEVGSQIEAAILREIIDEIASDLIGISSPTYSQTVLLTI
ncbi:hypothetical protein EJ110_NYTH31578 [Nymphaea thermarum]|nr:hypothetical protein EJ110_NYTH31578 [Nymphaea thermarum]